MKIFIKGIAISCLLLAQPALAGGLAQTNEGQTKIIPTTVAPSNGSKVVVSLLLLGLLAAAGSAGGSSGSSPGSHTTVFDMYSLN